MSRQQGVNLSGRQANHAPGEQDETRAAGASGWLRARKERRICDIPACVILDRQNIRRSSINLSPLGDDHSERNAGLWDGALARASSGMISAPRGDRAFLRETPSTRFSLRGHRPSSHAIDLSLAHAGKAPARLLRVSARLERHRYNRAWGYRPCAREPSHRISWALSDQNTNDPGPTPGWPILKRTPAHAQRPSVVLHHAVDERQGRKWKRPGQHPCAWPAWAGSATGSGLMPACRHAAVTLVRDFHLGQRRKSRTLTAAMAEQGDSAARATCIGGGCDATSNVWSPLCRRVQAKQGCTPRLL